MRIIGSASSTSQSEPRAQQPPFDDVAGSYDSAFGGSPAGRLFRFRLAERIAQRVKPGSALLDIGCGTGDDAVWLQGCGFAVLGIDPSVAMIEVARGKAEAMHTRPEFRVAGFENFDAPDGFDAVYSNFGAMNCLPIEAWKGALSKVLRPGGQAFLVLMGRRPFPEFLRVGRSAWNRRLQPTAQVGARSIAVTYPTPPAVAAALLPAFKVDRTEALGFLVPGPRFTDWPRRHPIGFGLVAAMERVVARRRFLCEFSDHFLIELSRR